MLLKPKKTYFFYESCSLILLCIYILFGIQFSIGQEQGFKVPDSLKKQSYDELYASYRNVNRDTIKSKLYLSAYLEKAIKDKDTIKMAMAYSAISCYISEESEKIALLDEAIAISEGLNDDKYPIKSYSFKGGYYLKKGQYQLALDNYIKALKLSEEVHNEPYIEITKHNIACIKTKIAKHKEALILFKANFEYKKKKYPKNDTYVLKSLIPMAESYRYNKMLDSATIYNREGIRLSIRNKKLRSRYYGKLVLNEGINLFYKEQYESSYDSIVKGISLLHNSSAANQESYILGFFYLGKLKLEQKDTLLAQKEFIKMDSIIQREEIALLETRKGYEFLISLNKANNNTEQELVYVNRLLSFDKILNQQRDSISNKLFKEFDTPMLLKDKESLILELKNSARGMIFLISFLIILSIIIGVFMYYQYKNKKEYKQKFNELVNKNKTIHKTQKKSLDEIGIAEEVVEHILNSLEVFEQKNQFLKKNLSIGSLAKRMNTNTKYLSKIINHHKDKSFTHYINELRVEYSVEQLQESEKLKNYTIQGIAEEMGFNSAESFSSAFKRSTGIKPSYFLQKLCALNAE
ncbi:AraC family transcriptional regulator [Aquimarina aggregata]|uniref:AraC family transcriptional regulator n=1 Tax=Aquimarina aggregata TaxID=1642818 RepID=UPI00248F488F|nr:AraC family transcriptional regulator [Aquimarina aggregata]